MADRKYADVFRVRAVAVLLAVLTLALYFPVANYDFVALDDGLYIRDNPMVRQGLSPQGAAWAFGSVGYAGNWHPLTWLSHMLDVQLFGLRAGGHHLVSALLHAANAALLLLLVNGLTGALWPAALTAALFAVHPLRVESVAWVSERKDVLSGFFGLLALLAYLAYARRPSAARFAAVAGLLALGLMSKPMLVVLPLLVLLLDWWPLGRFAQRGSVPRLLAEKAPLLALAAAAAAVTLAAQQRSGSLGLMSAGHDALRFSNAALSVVRYLGKTFWPSDLMFFYELPPSPPLRQAAAALALVAAVSLAAIVVRRRAPWLAAGWFWFLLGLLPVIGIVQAGSQAMADRYTYLPTIGIALALSWGLREIARRRGRRPACAIAAAAGIAVVVLAALAHLQLPAWSGTEALYAHALAVAPGSARLAANAQYDRGVELGRQGRVAEARACFEAALRILPSHADAHNNLGAILAQEGRVEEAVPHFEAGLASSANAGPGAVKLHDNLGMAFRLLGRRREAIEQFRAALALGPADFSAHFNLGLLLEEQGFAAEALGHYREAVRIDPGSAKARAMLGQAVQRQR